MICMIVKGSLILFLLDINNKFQLKIHLLHDFIYKNYIITYLLILDIFN
jgi:hypothetical protein